MAFRSKRERFIKLSILFTVIVLGVILTVSRDARMRVRVIFSPDCIVRNQPVFSNRLNDRISDYSSAAGMSGIQICRDESELSDRVREGKLVHVSRGRSYLTDRLTHSYPYLTPGAKDLLSEIGQRFREKTDKAGLRGSKFIVTSMTRTTQKIKGLRKNNMNASANSPHLKGNAFDISYVRFRSRKFFMTSCDRKFFKETLAEVILELKEEKRCWATYEKQQTCFHVVAR